MIPYNGHFPPRQILIFPLFSLWQIVYSLSCTFIVFTILEIVNSSLSCAENQGELMNIGTNVKENVLKTKKVEITTYLVKGNLYC